MSCWQITAWWRGFPPTWLPISGSERKPGPKLNNAGVVGSGDLAEGSAVDVGARRAPCEGPVTIVDHVEELRTEFQLQPLGDGRGLSKGQVKVNVSRSAQEVARVGAVGGERRIRNDLRVGWKHPRTGNARGIR